VHIPELLSMAVVVCLLLGSAAASLVFGPPVDAKTAPETELARSPDRR